MSKGYVYILKNPSMPGILKIGKTTRSVEQRCNELWQTGVPTPFEIVAAYLSPDCDELERAIHDCMPDLRVSDSREFFRVDESVVSEIVQDTLREQVESLIAEFIPGETLVPEDAFVDPGDLGHVAYRAGITSAELAEAIRFLDPENIMPAVTRWRESRLRRGIVRDYSAADVE